MVGPRGRGRAGSRARSSWREVVIHGGGSAAECRCSEQGQREGAGRQDQSLHGMQVPVESRSRGRPGSGDLPGVRRMVSGRPAHVTRRSCQAGPEGVTFAGLDDDSGAGDGRQRLERRDCGDPAPAGAGGGDGRRRARGPPEVPRQAHGARAHRRAARPGHVPRMGQPRRRGALRRRRSAQRHSVPRAASWAVARSTAAPSW